MKFKIVLSLLLGAALFTNAQGYKDGIEYYKAGQFDNAITILSKNMNSAGTDKALANYYLGQSYLQKGEIQKAKSYFEAGISADPNCGYNYVGIGAIDLLGKNKSAAEENFKKAQSMSKKNNELLVDIARAYYKADPVAYAKEIDKYVEKARKDSKGTEPAIYIFDGDRKVDERDFNEAVRSYEQAINFDSDNAEGYVKYANAYFYVVPNFAINKLEELLAKKPNSALAQRELAEKYYANGQLTRAAAQYGKYMSNPNHFPQDKSRYAVLLFADKKYDDAIKTSQEVLAETPNDLTLNRIIYRSYIELADTDDAAAAESATENALASATKFFNNPQFSGRYNAGDFTIYGQFLSKIGKGEEAEAILKQGMVALPEDASVVRVLADVQSKNGKSGDAFESYTKYVALTPEPTAQDYNSGTLFALSAVSDAKDDADVRNKYAAQGLEYLNKILDPENPSANLLLRKVQILLNQNLGAVDANSEAAILELMNVLDKDPENANPQNSNNTLNVYRILYNQLLSYYERTGNKDAAADARDKLQKYSDLMGN